MNFVSGREENMVGNRIILVTSIFSFSHNASKSFLSQGLNVKELNANAEVMYSSWKALCPFIEYHLKIFTQHPYYPITTQCCILTHLR